MFHMFFLAKIGNFGWCSGSPDFFQIRLKSLSLRYEMHLPGAFNVPGTAMYYNASYRFIFELGTSIFFIISKVNHFQQVLMFALFAS